MTSMSPPKWSSWGCVSMTRSMLRSPSGMTASSAGRTPAFGPPSIRIWTTRPPDGSVISDASPCPTSRKAMDGSSPPGPPMRRPSATFAARRRRTRTSALLSDSRMRGLSLPSYPKHEKRVIGKNDEPRGNERQSRLRQTAEELYGPDLVRKQDPRGEREEPRERSVEETREPGKEPKRHRKRNRAEYEYVGGQGEQRDAAERHKEKGRNRKLRGGGRRQVLLQNCRDAADAEDERLYARHEEYDAQKREE